MTKIFHSPKLFKVVICFLPEDRAQTNVLMDKEIFSNWPLPCGPTGNGFRVMNLAEKVHAIDPTREAARSSQATLVSNC